MAKSSPSQSPQYKRDYYEANRPVLLAKQSTYAKARLLGPGGDRVRGLRKARVIRFRKRKPEEYRRWNRDRRARMRAEMFAACGGHCVCCGETAKAFLTLDHIRRDGRQHRLMLGGKRVATSYQIYADLKKQGWPKDGYRVLCMNCNFATRYGAACPHKQLCVDRHAAFLSVV